VTLIRNGLTLGSESGWQQENGTPHFSTPGDEQLK